MQRFRREMIYLSGPSAARTPSFPWLGLKLAILPESEA